MLICNDENGQTNLDVRLANETVYSVLLLFFRSYLLTIKARACIPHTDGAKKGRLFSQPRIGLFEAQMTTKR